MYYLIDDDDDYYEDSGHIMEYPQMPSNISFNSGARIASVLKTPLKFRMDPEWGSDPMLIMGVEIPLFHKDFVMELNKLGVDNIDTYDAEIENPYTNSVLKEYYAVNIIGIVAAADLSKSKFRSFSNPPAIDTVFTDLKIDESKVKGLLMFRMAESVTDIVVHEKVKKGLEKKYPSLEFLPV